MADPCTYDPVPLLGEPIGMFHCPECGEMVVGGVPHPPYHLGDALYSCYEDTPPGLCITKSCPVHGEHEGE